MALLCLPRERVAYVYGPIWNRMNLVGNFLSLVPDVVQKATPSISMQRLLVCSSFLTRVQLQCADSTRSMDAIFFVNSVANAKWERKNSETRTANLLILIAKIVSF